MCSYTTNRKYNLDRHTQTVHVTQGQNVTSQEQFVTKQSIQGQYVTEPIVSVTSDYTKCPHCYKTFSCSKSLNRHIAVCQHTSHPLQCWKCKSMFNNRMAKSRHMKNCIGPIEQSSTEANDQALSIGIQNNCQNQLNIQNQQNIQTQNNNVTNNVVVKFPGFCDEDFDFDREHISSKRLNAMWDCSRPEIGFYKYASAILENPKNRYVKKTDAKANHSSIHTGDGEWELALDKDVFPRLTFDMSVSALGAYNDNKKNLKLLKTNVQRIFQYLDNVNTENDPDFTDALQRLKLIIVNHTKKWDTT